MVSGIARYARVKSLGCVSYIGYKLRAAYRFVYSLGSIYLPISPAPFLVFATCFPSVDYRNRARGRWPFFISPYLPHLPFAKASEGRLFSERSEAGMRATSAFGKQTPQTRICIVNIGKFPSEKEL